MKTLSLSLSVYLQLPIVIAWHLKGAHGAWRVMETKWAKDRNENYMKMYI